LAVLAVGCAVLVSTAHVAGGAAAAQPNPTSAPDAPGITIASEHMDLSGSWLVADKTQYVLFSSTAFGNPHDNVPMMVGRPGDWSAPTDALPQLPDWALSVTQGGTTWEPETAQFGGRYVLYYSASVRHSKPLIHCLGTAVADTLTGPYTPSRLPIICQLGQGGDIDPQVVVDPNQNGRRYLAWKSDNNSMRGVGLPKIWSQPLAPDGLSVEGSPTVIYRAASAPSWVRPVVEAPQLVTSPFGGWWLFYSGGGGFTVPNYAIDVASCRSISGPCTPVGTHPLISTNRQGQGPGEETFFRSAGSDWLLYNPWRSGIAFRWFRPIDAARVGWTPAGPYIAENGAFPAP
jgi:beta-xylosidase